MKERKVLTLSFPAMCLVLLTAVLCQAYSPQEYTKIRKAVPEEPIVQPEQHRVLMVFTRCEGYKHESIPYWADTMKLLGEKTGAFTVVKSNTMTVFSEHNLEQFDAICLDNTTRLEFDDPNRRKHLLDFVRSGKGLVGIHAATDNFYDCQEASKMLGGQFAGHPWGAGGTWTVKIEDPDHKLNAPFKGKDFKIKDEIYRIKGYCPREFRTLLKLDLTDRTNQSVKGLKHSDKLVPISWIRSYGQGRVFYCSLGHNPEVCWNRDVLKHYLAGVQFALGDLDVDTTPDVQMSLEGISGYEYGKSRRPLTRSNEYIRFIGDDCEKLRMLEEDLVNILDSDATMAGKQFACRKLGIIGTEVSVPVLAEMLTEKSSSRIQPADIARYALERIDSPEACEALRDALDETEGVAKVGIINSLGERGDEKAVGRLSELLESSETKVVEAAISALGKIGGKEAASSLRRAQDDIPSSLRTVWADAYLNCADKFQKEGYSRPAFRIYQRMYEQDKPTPARGAALRGMVKSRPAKTVSLIIDAIEKGDEHIQEVAAGLLREVPSEEVISSVIDRLPGLSATAKVQVLSALGDRGDKSAISAVINETGSEQARVRTAAVRALGKLGGASHVKMLAEKAAESAGAEQQAARESLYRLRAVGVDRRILSELPKAGPELKLEYIRAVGNRNIKEGVDTLLQSAKSARSKVSVESLKVLSDLAGPSALPEVTEILLADDINPRIRSQAESTAATLARKIEDEKEQAEPIISAYSSAEDVESRCSLLSVMGVINGDSSLEVLQDALSDEEEQVQTTAIRALSNWPGPEPIDALKEVAQSSDNRVQRVLAFRGFVRLIGKVGGPESSERFELYTQAMDLAEYNTAKRMVLAGLGEMRSFETLEMVEDYLDAEQLRAEAEAALVNIAKGTIGTHPEKSRSVLRKVLQQTKSDMVRKQAEKLLSRLSRSESYIKDWMVSGPYTKEGMNCRQLFDVAFAPEKDEPAEWSKISAGTDPDKLWLVDLDRAIGGGNRVAYLKTKVWSPQSKTVLLQLGSNDGIKAWLNGKEVHSNNTSRRVTRDQDKTQVKLEKGWNTLLMKITQSGGSWGACARFVNPDGSEIEGLKVKAGE